MKLTLVTVAILLCGMVYGQYSKSFGFVEDNDAFISLTKDQYYTNGLIFSYQFLSNKTSDKLIKKIYNFQIGQFMFTPSKPNVPDIVEHDRPFAGYLFANFGVTNYYKKQQFLRLNYQLGILGPGSQADDVQKWLHRTFSFKNVAGWEYQIRDQIGINIDAFYLKNLQYYGHGTIDLNIFSEVKFGTIFNQLGIGFISRIGFKNLASVSNTVLFNSNISHQQKRIKEFYFYVKPQFTYVISNATLEGSLFNNNSPVTFNAEPLTGSLQFGLKCTTKHFNLGYSISYLTQSVDNNRDTAHAYGSVDVIYFFN
jgi:hypothetical protein